MKEVWKPVKVWGFYGRYEISNLCRIKSLYKSGPNNSQKRQKPYVSDGYKMVSGYYSTALSCKYKLVFRRINRLVLETFIGKAPHGYQAAHLDGDKSNNKLTNLAWVTAKTNAAHKNFHGTQPQGEKCGNARLTEDQVREIRKARFDGITGTSLAIKYGVPNSQIYRISLGKSWKHVK